MGTHDEPLPWSPSPADGAKRDQMACYFMNLRTQENIVLRKIQASDSASASVFSALASRVH